MTSKYYCNRCGEYCPEPGGLRRHKREAQCTVSAFYRDVFRLSSARRCRFCGKNFVSEQNRRRHVWKTCKHFNRPWKACDSLSE